MADQAILLVDDEAQILNSLRRVLRKEPYKVFTAESGAEGLEILQENAIQVIVSDQRMPNMTGAEFLLEAKEICPDTVRIMLSGYAEPEAILASINQGEVFRFLAKPWVDEDLKVTIRQSLRHYDIVQENRDLTAQSERHVKELEKLNGLLQCSVEERTRSLQFSQEVFENLPLSVMGISQEEEIVLTNETARNEFESLRSLIPGTDMADILPDEAVVAIRECITATECENFDFNWDSKAYCARPQKLGADGEPRGLVLLVEEKV